MRVFVTGTGRCGTTTFSKACSHIKNYTSGHETKRGFDPGCVNDFPDNHIEVDPHLFWHMGSLIVKYSDACWVHLIRERESCIKSLTKTSGIWDWSNLAYGRKPEVELACADYYDSVNQVIPMVLMGCCWMTMHLEKLQSEWSSFWEWIGAEGDYDASWQELGRRYNAR